MLNENIKTLRKRMGLTQVELAERLNVSQSTITSWENGTRRPDLDLLPVIAQIFGVSADYLLGITDDPSPVAEQELIEAEATIRERLRRDPSYRLLFDAANKATPESLKAAAAVLKALEPKEDE